jgi:pimeloyl-ACP methyl ester carboxylesterase
VKGLTQGIEMIVSIIKWSSISVVVLILATVLLFTIGSQVSLDRDYQHTESTKTLPEFSPRSNGLVRISANGHEFRARVAGFDGSTEKPAVILLHGFPVTSAMWNALMTPLTDAGFRVVAFDQRGYSPGARPEELSEYQVSKLTADVVAVADATGLEKFHLIGHDWGAGVGWSTVMQHPGRIVSWTALSIAHPAAFGAALQNDPDQQSKSSYFLLFQTPWLPETLFTFNSLSALDMMYSTMSSEQIDEYHSVFAEPGALTGALNWYRAMTLGQDGSDDVSMKVSTPTLFIWGNHDEAVGRVAIEMQTEYITGPYSEIELDAGHWLLTDSPREVVESVVRHLTTYK